MVCGMVRVGWGIVELLSRRVWLSSSEVWRDLGSWI